MIEVENLSFSYQNNKVLKNVSFSIEKGEYLCIIGKNGSGKSTLAKLLAALIFQQEGTIKISGYDTKNQKDLLNIRKIVGIIFQNPEEQIISTTVFDEVIFALENLAIPREDIKEIAEKALKTLNLQEYKDRLTYQLSGGEKKELNSQGKTIIHITHDRDDILEASKVMLLSEGEIKYLGSPYKVFDDDIAFLLKIKNILEKHNIKVEDENINMEDLVKIVYENIY